MTGTKKALKMFPQHSFLSDATKQNTYIINRAAQKILLINLLTTRSWRCDDNKIYL